MFLDQITLPDSELILNISADEVITNTFSSFEIAMDNKFCYLIKDAIDRIFQIMEPSFVLKQRILLS